MIHLIFTIYDQKAHAHLTPFYLPTTAMAERTFTDCVNSEDHQFGKHPADYTLIHTGTWDDNNNQFVINDLPTVLGTGIQYVSAPDLPGEPYVPEKSEEQVSNDPPVLASTKS